MQPKNDIYNRDEYYDKDEKTPLSELISKTAKEISLAKEQSAKEFNVIGSKFLNEISSKEQRNEKNKQKYIKWILKNSDSISFEDLNELICHDVKTIYLKMKEEKKLKLKNIFNFLLNQ